MTVHEDTNVDFCKTDVVGHNDEVENVQMLVDEVSPVLDLLGACAGNCSSVRRRFNAYIAATIGRLTVIPDKPFKLGTTIGVPSDALGTLITPTAAESSALSSNPRRAF